MTFRLPLLLLLAACSTGSANTLAGATTITAAAIGVAAAERSAGGCIAICTNGTVCNTKTGLCEQLPCRGRCGETEHCEETFTESRCIPGAAASVVTQAKGTRRSTPAAVVPVTTPPDPNHAAPTIVPAAEQNQAK